MRARVRESVMRVIGLLFLALLGWGVYRLICLLIDLLSRADTVIAAAVVAGSLTVISSTIAVVVGRSFEARRDREAAHRERKIDLYDGFLSELFRIFGGGGVRSAGVRPSFLVFLRWELILAD